MYGMTLAAIVCGSLMNIFFSLSWQYNSIGIIAVLIYLAIPLGYFLDWLFLGRDFSTNELIGAGLICVVNIIIVSLRLLKVIS
jgi:drug/metabolite transporter (DMT)-like permease